MSWTERIAIFATTKMYNGICIAGLDSKLEWIRPVRLPDYSLHRSNLTREGEIVVEDYNLVEFSCIGHLKNRPHTEDVETDWSVEPNLRGRLDDDEVFDYINDTDETVEVGSGIKRYLLSQNRSIVNLRPDVSVDCYMERKSSGRVQRRMKFSVNGKGYDYPCTDLRWRAITRKGEKIVNEILNDAEDLALTIGLTRYHWGKYWPLVLTVHTYPLYDVEVDYERL